MVKTGYKQTEVGVIPEDWKLLLLGKVAKVYRGGSPRPIQNYITNSSNGVNWIKIGDVRENEKYIYSTQEKISPDGVAMSREVRVGDFILSNSMSFGRPYILRTNGCIHDGWLAIQEYGHAFSTEYLYYVLSSKIIYKQYIGMAAGSSVKNLNKDKVSSLMVICPPLPEQQRIAEALSDVDGMISSLEKLIAKYKSIKTACLQQMFPQNGETVPRMRLPGFTGAWEQRKLGDISGVYDGVHQTPFYTDSGIMFLSVENIGTLKSNKYISEEAFNRDYKVYPQKGDILMTRIGDVGTPNVVETSERVAFYVSLALLKPSNVDSYFLCNSILSPFFQSGLKERTLITAIPQKINKDEIGNVRLFLPSSTDEQVKIGVFFQQLDNLITLHQRKLEKIQKIKQGMMQQLLTGKIRLV